MGVGTMSENATDTSQDRLERKFREAMRWMKKANDFYKESYRPGFSRSLAENRLNEYFEAIEREIRG